MLDMDNTKLRIFYSFMYLRHCTILKIVSIVEQHTFKKLPKQG
jgi:hypothetical protein